ncbi:MAG: hypothetical protein ACOYKH_01325 [Brevefilum fermentans]|jgi:hypothetical protein|uniref:Glycosyltransferase subfamily 4-like N-terminal domain-containing protein n=1 Tax=Candidatus Brevifilum fermentans TaxID=1986204 RepID=A0A1Y6K3H1_9CHLR|nr:hypothetical protein [Brevefilum fermentans]MDI9567022.1 hypothetical protein [Chloroflexota bacterium]SMX54221.1 protein of unknown function [Brevefilum fermentans]
MAENPLLIVVNFFKQMQGQPCIVFLGGYPYPSRLGDGYYQRVASIGQQLSSFYQIYIDRKDLPDKTGWLDCPQPGILSLSIRHNWVARLTAIICILLAKKLYVHSIYPLKHLLFLLRLPHVLKLVDFHGAVPEEQSMMNDLKTSRQLEKMEKIAIDRADRYIFVTEAMVEHFSKKYHVSFSSNYFTIPIVPKLSSTIPSKPPIIDKPVVVYAGGIQVWQKIPEMIAAISNTVDAYQFRLFTTQPEEMRSLLYAKGVDHTNIEISRKTHAEIIEIYKDCHFGFLLRDDHVVNQVACPTKLIEYLAFGVLPILINVRIGDFSSMGMRYLSLTDFVNLKIPHQNNLKEMVEQNYNVYQSLQTKHNMEMELLKQYLSVER